MGMTDHIASLYLLRTLVTRRESGVGAPLTPLAFLDCRIWHAKDCKKCRNDGSGLIPELYLSGCKYERKIRRVSRTVTNEWLLSRLRVRCM